MKRFRILAMLGMSILGGAGLAYGAAEPLPWEREIPLREVAQSVQLQSTLHPTNPQPDYGGAPFAGPSMIVSSLKIRSTLWGPPVQIDKSNGECLVFQTVAGRKYRIEPQ